MIKQGNYYSMKVSEIEKTLIEEVKEQLNISTSDLLRLAVWDFSNKHTDIKVSEKLNQVKEL